MVTMENSDEILQILERFTRLKQKEIPKELEDYLQYVAKTGDTIFKWSSLKYLFREKLLNVIKHFNEDSPRLEEIPNYPNVDPFNYETMKSSLLERLDLFNAAPFTVQRLCELLIDPRKQYSRIDKFMRALEKNILVVSTIDPGRKRTESENGDSLDSVVNGDLSLEVNIDIEMENEALFNNGNAEEGSAPTSGSAGGAQKASCPRSDDNVLPKAKKAKLEIEGDERSEAADEVPAEPDANADADVAAKAKKDKEKEEKDKSDNDETDSPKEAAEIEEPDEEVDEADPEAKTTTKQAVNGSKKSSDQEESSPASVDEEVEDPLQSKSLEADKEVASKEKQQEVEKQGGDKKEAAEPQEEIAKKQEAENAENLDKMAEQLTDEKPASDKVTPPPDEVEKEEEPAKAERAEKEKEKEQQEKQKEKEKEDKSAPVAAEKQAEKETAETDEPAAAEKPTEEKAATAESKPKTKSEAKPEADETKESQPEKTEPEPATKSLPEEKESADESAGEAEKNNKKKEDDETAAAEAAVAAAAAAAAEPVKEPVKEPVEESQDGEASSSAVEDLAAATTPQSPLGAADSAAETPPAEATVDDSQASPMAAVTPPTLALNDQPMEDTPTEEEARASPSAAVEEVVMAESGPAAEMATDEAVTAAGKDEPAAMEVDDTSQEVMDQ